MKRNEVLRVIDFLSTYYSDSRYPKDGDGFNTWYEELKNKDYDKVMEIIREYVRDPNETYQMTLSAIQKRWTAKNYIEKKEKDSEEYLNNIEVFDTVEDRIRNLAENRKYLTFRIYVKSYPKRTYEEIERDFDFEKEKEKFLREELKI